MSRIPLTFLVATLAVTVLAATAPRSQCPRVFTITMNHDSTGQHFSPAVLEVVTGDTLRFINGVGHHNVDFVRDSNPPNVSLPRATRIAEQSGDVFVVPIALPPGHYTFQCDPHVTMGMIGHVQVDARTR